MKTNCNLQRQIGDLTFHQRTKDGYFNSTELLNNWNENNNEKRRFRDFIRNDGTQKFIKSLEYRIKEKGENLRPFINGRGRGNYTWLHPYLFIKFAMWLNPEFEVSVIEFVYDKLVEYRHQSGDNYNVFTRALGKLEGANFAQAAKGLNYIVFGRHQTGILRNTATEVQLKDLKNLEEQFAFAIDMGYIKTYSQLIHEMRKLWHLKRS